MSALTIIALALVLIGYPAFRMAIAYLEWFQGPSGDSEWWVLWGVILVGHWLCAALVLAAIASERATLKSIGLNTRIFVRGRLVFLIVLILAIAAALYAPGYFYGDDLPDRMQSHPLGPVSSAQRLFWILIAVTAGFVEEIVFRGYALTRLPRLFGIPFAILISIISFSLMHGPSALIPQFAALYLISGAIFAFAFLLMKSRRLEILIIAHTLIDLVIVAAP